MTPEQILAIAQAAIRYGPKFASGLVELFTRKDPTADDVKRWLEIADRPYSYYDPDLPVSPPPSG